MTSLVPAIDSQRQILRRGGAAAGAPAVMWVERIADCLVGLLAALVEAMALAWLSRSAALSVPAALAVHAAVAAVLWLWLRVRARDGRDPAVPQLMLLVMLATGPVGCALAALAALRPVADAADAPLLARWYERIALASDSDPVTDLADGVAIGRTLDMKRPVNISFEAVMRGNDIRSQQALLGLVARAFKPEYTPALALALRSEEPVIRVQAAAVATRVKPQLSSIIQAARGLVDDPDATVSSRLTTRRHLDLAIRSGLLEIADRADAVMVAADLDRTLDDPSAALAFGAAAGQTVRRVLALAPPARLEVEERLIAMGRFDDLRRLRRLMRLAAGRLYRVRSMPRPPQSTALAVVTP